MTDEEINRKFDVVAGHLATLAVGQQQLQEAMGRAEKRWERSEKRWERTEEGIRSLLAIAELHAGELEKLRESGKATDERLNVLINTVERYISGGRDGGGGGGGGSGGGQ